MTVALCEGKDKLEVQEQGGVENLTYERSKFEPYFQGNQLVVVIIDTNINQIQ